MKLFLKRDSFRGDRGDDGFELLAALGVVLEWNMGLSFVEGGSEALVVVRQRKLGLEMGCDCRRGVVGLLPPERKASLAQLLGTGL